VVERHFSYGVRHRFSANKIGGTVRLSVDSSGRSWTDDLRNVGEVVEVADIEKVDLVLGRRSAVFGAA